MLGPDMIQTEAWIGCFEFGKDQKFFSWMWNPQAAKVVHEKEYHSSVKRKSIRAQSITRHESLKAQESLRLDAPLANTENV